MTATRDARVENGQVAIDEGGGADRDRWLEELEARGASVPLYHRPAWSAVEPGRQWFVTVRAADGRLAAAFPVRVVPSRVLPGHAVLRVIRLRPEPDPDAVRRGLDALIDRVRRDSRLLRLHVELFTDAEGTLDAFGQRLREHGMTPAAWPRMYRTTLSLDLRPSEDAIFRSLHATGRRHVRAADKRPVALRAVTSPDLASTLQQLMRETMTRTGGPVMTWDWRAVIRLAVERPRWARLVGLFRDDGIEREDLLAFALGVAHGDHVEYAAAASTRAPDLRMPLGYAPAWELIRWGKATGARWFDFGGLTPSDLGPDDPTAGIADFKRYFGGRELRISEEWVLEPPRIRTRVARVMSALARRARGR